MTDTPFTLSYALDNYLVGQKRTGRHKQFVFLVDDFVYKGPYKEERLKNVLGRSAIYQKWNSPCVIKAIDCITTVDGIFVRFPNFMKEYELTGTWHTESWETDGVNLKYQILNNPPVTDVGKLLMDNSWIFDHVEDLLVGLCHGFILGVGDTNLHNTMVDPQKKVLYIIDFDDNMSNEKEDECFYYTLKPGKKYNWYEQVRKYYFRVADRLTPLLQDEIVVKGNLIERVEKTINLLRKFSGETERLPTQIQVNDKRLQLIIKNSPTQTQIRVEEIEKEKRNIGQMMWNGMRGGSKTFSGISFDVAKSAVQKYIRRNMVQKAILSGIEIYRFSEVGGSPGVTNLFNRLAIISCEDISPRNLGLILSVVKYVESKEYDLIKMVTMIQLLAESSKTRIMSHLWRAYARPNGREKSIAYGLSIDVNFNPEDVEYVQKNLRCDLFVESDPIEIRSYILIFLKRLQDQNRNAYTWASYYIEKSRNLNLTKRKKFVKGNSRSTTGKPDILLWKALSVVLDPEVHDVLVDAYFNHTESRPFLQTAILIALNRLPYENFDEKLEKYCSVWRDKEGQHYRILQQMMNGNFILEIDDFVIDKHTKMGRSLGKTRDDFVHEGARVIPQDVEYYDEILEKIYQES